MCNLGLTLKDMFLLRITSLSCIGRLYEVSSKSSGYQLHNRVSVGVQKMF